MTGKSRNGRKGRFRSEPRGALANTPDTDKIPPEPKKTKGASWEEVPRRLRPILAARPIRNEDFLRWERKPDGTVVITHSKNFRPWERKWMKVFGGSPILKRPLDKYGSDIWVLCDGEHTVAAICDTMDRKYMEQMEPVLTRVTQFIGMLLERNLVYLKGSEADLARSAKLGMAPKNNEKKVGADKK